MARPTKHEARYKYVGRATKLTPEVLTKLEQASAIDASPKQICLYASIAEGTYYRWLKENPELKERLDDLRQRRPLKANENIARALDNGDLALSKWELEHKEPEKYGEKIKIEHSGGISNENITEEDKNALKEFHEKLKKNLTDRSMKKAKEEGEI